MITEPAVEGSLAVSLYADALALVSERFKSDAWKKVDEIEEEIAKLPPIDFPLTHIFTTGMYTRKIFMSRGPADAMGVLLTSRIHLTDHPFELMSGVVSVWDDEAGWVTMRGPCDGVTKAGTRRILFIHEDAVWITHHVTDETDPDEAVRKLTYSEGKFSVLGMASARKSDSFIRTPVGDAPRNADYAHFLSKHHLVERDVLRMMDTLPAATRNAAVDDHFCISESSTQGVGLFAARKIVKGERFPVCDGSTRFNTARYVNHSYTPNVVYDFEESGKCWMTTLVELGIGMEVFVDYEDNMNKSGVTSDTVRNFLDNNQSGGIS